MKRGSSPSEPFRQTVSRRHLESLARSNDKPLGNALVHPGLRRRYDVPTMRLSLAGFVLSLAACSPQEGMMIARLGSGGDGLEAIQTAFAARNPGFALEWASGVRELRGEETTRVAFIQAGETVGHVGERSSEVTIADVVVLRRGEGLRTDADVDVLVFTVPEPVPDGLPTFLRPDWDPDITDVVGGCATEEGAYRRIVLTWDEANGKYVYRGLNAHRVRIMDSFSHYHPVAGGFDEFYLVQMAQPRARILTSDQTSRIENPESVRPEEVGSLLRETPLQVGDLVYLPRGVVHRGLDGVLAHVIAVPGFIPGTEIGVDHHLRRINERLSLGGDEELPFHAPAGEGPLIK